MNPSAGRSGLPPLSPQGGEVEPSTDPVTAGVEQLLRPDDVARILCIGKRTLERWISSGRFPRPDIKIGPKITLYRPGSVQGWIEAQSRKLPGQGGHR